MTKFKFELNEIATLLPGVTPTDFIKGLVTGRIESDGTPAYHISYFDAEGRRNHAIVNETELGKVEE